MTSYTTSSVHCFTGKSSYKRFVNMFTQWIQKPFLQDCMIIHCRSWWTQLWKKTHLDAWSLEYWDEIGFCQKLMRPLQQLGRISLLNIKLEKLNSGVVAILETKRNIIEFTKKIIILTQWQIYFSRNDKYVSWSMTNMFIKYCQMCFS